MSEPAAAPAKRRWRRRLVRIGLVVVAVLVVFRLTLLILLPTVISRTARSLGLDCEYQRMKLSLLGTNASLWGVRITSRDGTQEVLKAEYANANLSTLQLARLRLVAFRLEAEGVEVGVERTADGSIPLLTLLASQAPPPSNAAPGKPKPPNFSSPLEIHALRLYKLALRIKDDTHSPPYEDTVRMDLRVTDLGRRNRPVRVEFDASSSDLFSNAAFLADANLTASSVDADLTLSLRGLKADRLAPYLSALGIAADDRSLNIRGSGRLSLAASSVIPGALQGTASLSGIAVTADADSVASLKTVSIDIASLSPSSLHVRDIQIAEGTLRTERTPQGRIRFAAFGPAAVRAVPSPAAPPAPAPPRTRSGSTFQWQVEGIRATNLTAFLDDRALTPARTHSFQITSATIKDVRGDGPPDTTSTLSAQMTAPGLIGSIRAEAIATPFVPEPRAHATISIEAIHPGSIEPYLKAAGIESIIDAASVRFDLEAAMKSTAGGPAQSSFTLDRIIVQDRDSSLFEFGPVRFAGVARDADGTFNIDSIHGSGPSLNIRRLKDGRFEAFGLRIGPAPLASAPASPAVAEERAQIAIASPGTAPHLHLPPLRLNTLTWDGLSLRFEDETTPDLPPIEFSDAGIEVRNINIASAAGAAPGTYVARFRAPNLLNSLTFEGTIAATANSFEASGTVRGEGLSLTRLAPYLGPLGIEPRLAGGALAAEYALGASDLPDGIRLRASAGNIAVTDRDASLFSLASAKLDALDIKSGSIAVGTATVSGLDIAASRDRTGISLIGLKLLPSQPAPDAADGPLPDPLAIIGAMGPISLHSLSIDNSRVSWSDSAAKSPVTLTCALTASIGALSVNPGSPDATAGTWDLRLAAPGAVEDFTIRGTLAASASGVGLDCTATGRGLSTAVPAAYLPPGIDAAINSGEVSFKAGLSLERVQPTALAASFTIRDLDYRSPPESLAHIDALDLEVARLDPVTKDLHIRRIAVEGISAAANTGADGRLSSLGFSIGAPPQAQPAAAESSPATPAMDARAQHAPDVRAIIERSQRPQPLITIDTVDIGVRAVSITGPPPAAPLALADFSLRSTEPFYLLGPKAETNAPAKFIAQGRITPLISEFKVTADTAPFATEPHFNLTVAASGINGTQLTEVVPDLDPFIEGSSLTDARFSTSITSHAKVQRRGSTIDWSRGMDLSITLVNTEFRAGETLLGGVGKIVADPVRIDPSSGNIFAREVEVQNLAGNAWRDAAGIHIFGLIVKVPEAPAAESKPAAAAIPPAPHAPAPAPTSEIRIDRLTATGIDFKFEDRAVQPPVTIPINALDAEVRGLSSQLLARERPIRFNATVGAGKVSLPKAGRSSSDEGTPEVEDRDFFSQCIASGTMALYPAPRGRAIASISGVELSALRGLAQAAGASVGGGVFDGRVDLSARDDGNVRARARLVVTDLRYAEPESGPVQKFMALPVPMDAAIAAVEAPDGSITLPVDVTLNENGLTTGSLISSIAVAAGQVVATAVLSAPVKIVAGFAGLFGNSSPDIQWVEQEPIVLSYPDGVTTLPPESFARLHAVLERARSTSGIQVAIEHNLGTLDAVLLAQRSNPPPADVAALASELRARRASLISERSELLPAASAWAVGITPDPAAQARLKDLSRRLADLEDSMDQLYALQGPGAESSKARRARTAAVELIDARMAAVRNAIERYAGTGGASRTAVAGGRPIAGDSDHSSLIIRVREQK